MREESFMGMNEQEIQFVKKHIEDADDILNSKDYEVRFAEHIADQVVMAKRQDQHDQAF